MGKNLFRYGVLADFDGVFEDGEFKDLIMIQD